MEVTGKLGDNWNVKVFNKSGTAFYLQDVAAGQIINVGSILYGAKRKKVG